MKRRTRHIVAALLLLLKTAASFCQEDAKSSISKLQEDSLQKKLWTDSTRRWIYGGVLSLNGQQVSLTNWAAGGNSSISIGSLVNIFSKYKIGKSRWDNNLDLAYGVIKQGGYRSWWKNDDRIQFTTKYGRQASGNWYYSVLGDFRTQFADGFNYPNDSIYISRFMAPAYAILALGMDYKPNDNFSVFVSPLAGKFTFVNDAKLAKEGAFGVQKEISYYDSAKKTLIITQHYKTHREEFGAYIKLQYRVNVMKNITFQTMLELFSNYLHNPQNIDVNWTTLTNFKVNNLISVIFTTQLIYDDDINVLRNAGDRKGTVGPGVQFKQVFGIGLSYKL